MMSPPLNRTWLFSNGAGRLFFVSAIAGIGFFFLLFAIGFKVGFAGELVLGFWFEALLQLFFTMFTVGLAIVWIAMWLCLLNFEKESLAGSVYLPVFMLLGPLGTLIYYFARYRKLLNTSPRAVAISV